MQLAELDEWKQKAIDANAKADELRRDVMRLRELLAESRTTGQSHTQVTMTRAERLAAMKS